MRSALLLLLLAGCAGTPVKPLRTACAIARAGCAVVGTACAVGEELEP